MAVSFIEKEKAGIVKALRVAAGRHAASMGMRKTTVDELASEAGISKGAFYKFYPSKEHLFLDVLEQWYHSIYEKAQQALWDNSALPPRERAAMILKATLRAMRAMPLMRFCQDEIPLMVRKLPETLLKEHYQSADEFISTLINRSGVELTVPNGVACAVVKVLFLSLLTAQDVGQQYESAMDELIEGACRQMIKQA